MSGLPSPPKAGPLGVLAFALGMVTLGLLDCVVLRALWRCAGAALSLLHLSS